MMARAKLIKFEDEEEDESAHKRGSGAEGERGMWYVTAHARI